MNIEEDRIKTNRVRIDLIDDQLLRLLSVRAQIAIEIARVKRESGIELYDPSREQDVVRRVLEANPGVLESDAVSRLFTEIVSESRRAAERSTSPQADSASAAQAAKR